MHGFELTIDRSTRTVRQFEESYPPRHMHCSDLPPLIPKNTTTRCLAVLICLRRQQQQQQQQLLISIYSDECVREGSN